MITLSEVENSAMLLSESERAKLASQLLISLPPVFSDDDDGLAEALRRE